MSAPVPALGFAVRRRAFAPTDFVVMAIVNRTPDSFYDRGATYGFQRALERVRQCAADGADLVDIGGVKAGPGDEVDVAEELRRTVDFVGTVRAEHPDLLISVDTWRHEVGRAVLDAGADILNDAWGAWDPRLVEVAAEYDAGLVITHAGGSPPRTRPHRVAYDDVMADVLRRNVSIAERATSLGLDPRRLLLDPGHDFAKNTWHSLEVTRRLPELIGAGYPVLVSLSNKDFVGETLGVEVDDRLTGTLACISVCAWLGAQVYRVHQVRETRQALDMVSSIRGSRQPARTIRGLA